MARNLPPTAKRFADEYTAVWKAHQRLGEACGDAGPLDGRTLRLAKLALAVAEGSEGAVHSHVRRGLDEGLAAAEMEHVAVLAIPTIGFPKAIAALTWIRDVTEG